MGNKSTLTEVLEHTANLYPGRCAYRFGEDDLSYAELLRKAKNLSGYLEAKGINQGDRIGLMCNKGLPMIVSLYGILFAGAAYVPIDINAPEIRVQDIATQCGIKFVIASDGLANNIHIDRVDILAIEELFELTNSKPDQVAAVQHNPCRQEDLAYIIFTSGSTGTPKGIAHTHASAVAFARMMVSHFDLQPEDRLIGISPLQFDMSTFDIFASDYAGACTVLVSEAHIKMAASLTHLVEKEEISIWYSTPFSLVHSLDYGALETRNLSALRWVIYGGEAIAVNKLESLMSLLQHARFSNVYGPAEVNVCHIYDIPADFSFTRSTVPIGLPCQSVATKIVDMQGLDAPQGELWVAAPTMMTKYWNASELTDKVVHVDNSGTRYYKTGDTVEVGTDGLFYFLGRSDRQIKMRGYRIELSEIENVLGAIPGINQVYVFVDRTTAMHELCAHIAVGEPSSLTIQEIKQLLSKCLPKYAIPARFITHSAFPITSSGKIDRQTLIAL